MENSNTEAFEKAASAKGYNILHIFYKKGKVTKIHGTVPTVAKIKSENGHKYVNAARKVRWNSDGKCFSFTHNFRLRNYDLVINN